MSSKRLMQIACTVDFGVTSGQNFGSLFEAYDVKGLVVFGAGFSGLPTPACRMDRYTLQVFVRNEKYQVTFEKLLPLPNVSMIILLPD